MFFWQFFLQAFQWNAVWWIKRKRRAAERSRWRRRPWSTTLSASRSDVWFWLMNTTVCCLAHKINGLLYYILFIFEIFRKKRSRPMQCCALCRWVCWSAHCSPPPLPAATRTARSRAAGPSASSPRCPGGSARRSPRWASAHSTRQKKLFHY